MKRTTTCPSKRCPLLAAAALAVAVAPVAAQDTTVTNPPTVHVVRTGETLWTLAEFYLGDPLLWPQIYRVNTMVVEDPHWIFPGEELFLSERPDATAVTTPEVVEDPEPQAVAPPPPPPPTSGQTPTVFARNRRRPGSSITMISDPRNRPITPTQFYSSGFLTEEERFPWASVLGASGRSTLGTLTATSSAKIHQRLKLVAPRAATYQIGDSLLVAQRHRRITGWGDVVIPTGIVRVVAASGPEIEAEVVTQYAVVADGQVALPLEPFMEQAGLGQTVPIENGMSGTIIALRDRNEVPNQQDFVFIDRGREDGVALGDIFEVLVPEQGFAGSPDRQVATVKIVHVRGRSATGYLLSIADLGVEDGAPVRLIRKMAS